MEGYSIYEGSHSYFRDESNRTLVAVVREEMRVAYVLPQSYAGLTQEILKQFVDNALANKLKRVVDNTIPTQAKLENVKIYNNETFLQYSKENKINLVLFFHPEDQSSKYFTRRYDLLAQIFSEEEETKNIGVCAIDCKASKDFCEEKVIQYYPTIRLYVHGISIEYEKQKNLPQIPDIQKFIVKKLNNKPILVSDASEIKSPAVIMSGAKILPELEILAMVYDKIPIYFEKKESEKYTLDLKIGDQYIGYQGNFQVVTVKQWLNAQTGPLLSDMMSEIPDDRIIMAIQNRKPIVFLLDVEKDKSAKIRAEFGVICKNLSLAGGYADSEHPGFSELLQWVKIQKPQKSMIIYSETLSDKKYIYPHAPAMITKELFSEFIENIKGNKIPETGS